MEYPISLDHAILGFLNYHPYSGYNLKKIFDTSVRHFWPADQSQIYRTLAAGTGEVVVRAATLEWAGNGIGQIKSGEVPGRQEK